jgi:hypothetical protein
VASLTFDPREIPSTELFRTERSRATAPPIQWRCKLTALVIDHGERCQTAFQLSHENFHKPPQAKPVHREQPGLDFPEHPAGTSKPAKSDSELM